LAKFALKTHAACDPEARNDTPFDPLAGFAGSFTGPPILSPGIDRGEQQIGRARRMPIEAGSVAFEVSVACWIWSMRAALG
jgi:hypothetical protein